MNATADLLGTYSVIASLAPFVEAGEIAGAVVLAARDGCVLEWDAVGYADLEAPRPMEEDDLFWIASMTKPVIDAAVLMLADEGRLSLDDSPEKHLPEFARRWVIAERQQDRLSLHLDRDLTLRHLLAHTDGLADVRLPSVEMPLSEWVATMASQPLQFVPGSAWAYNNTGFNVLGRVIEVASRQALPDFLQQRFFGPLGMNDTTFFPSVEQARRLALPYEYGPGERRLRRVPLLHAHGNPALHRPTVFPGGGLFSTAPDMFIFYQMLLDYGVSRGRRFLSEPAWHDFVACQTGEMKAGFTGGMGFGLGVGVVREPTGLTKDFSPGTFGHGGVYGTQAWVDPVRRSTSILMCQRSNLAPNPDGSELRRAFNAAVARLLDAAPDEAASS